MSKQRWWDEYQSLNLCGGTISFILEDDEEKTPILTKKNQSARMTIS